MALMMKPMTRNPELDAAIERAVAAYNSMTPQQKREMHQAQQRSWVIGNMMLDHPEMTREYVENIYDRVVCDNRVWVALARGGTIVWRGDLGDLVGTVP